MKRLLTGILICAVSLPAIAEQLGAEAYGLLKTTYGYDADFPLDAKGVGVLRQNGVTWEKVSFKSFHDGLVPAILAVPEGHGPFPVVLLLHGIAGNKRQWLSDAFTHGGEVSAGLLASGYAVMALDAQYHGERAVYNDFLDPGEMVFRRGWGMRYAHLMTQTVVDYRRAIDYLATRDDIDTSRVGILGYSMGGHMTFILGAVEPRVKAVVACVVPATPGMPMAASQFARDLGAAPLLLLMGRQDRFYTVDQAEALFARVPGERKTLRLYDSGHSLPEAYVSEAVAWLRANL
ncbi:MAG TPA: alpha/beta fold hydrolase [Pseudomonadales bacterium]